MNVKYALAAAQMTLACALERWDTALWAVAWRRCDMPGPTPAFRMLMAINAPLAVPRMAWRAVAYTIWDVWLYYSDMGILAAAVGLFWYWVGMNVQAWHTRRMILKFSWRPVRFLLDVLLILSGLFCGLAGFVTARDVVRYWPGELHELTCWVPTWINTWSSGMVALALLSGSLVLVFFYGRDFVLAVRSK